MISPNVLTTAIIANLRDANLATPVIFKPTKNAHHALKIVILAMKTCNAPIARMDSYYKMRFALIVKTLSKTAWIAEILMN
jgi:hypothetical protein